MKKVYTIGRDPQSDIVINDNTDIVSRLHATIRIDGNRMFLIDQSQNGTYVNGMRMSANEEIPISRKDTISFANVAEFDWTLIPDPKKSQIKSIGIVVVSLIAIAAIVWGILYFKDDKGKTTNEESKTTLTTDSTSISNDTKDAIEPDSVPVETVTTPEPKTTSPKGEKMKGSNKEKKEGEQKEDKKEPQKPETDIPLY